MAETADIQIVDVTDEPTFARLPPCADGRFDHRSCDYWEDGVHGSKESRPRWWQAAAATAPPARPKQASDNPFAPAPREVDDFNPFAAASVAEALDPEAGDDLFVTPDYNPFAASPEPAPAGSASDPRKLRLLSRGLRVFGSYAKFVVVDAEAAVYAQFGPLSAFPRAQNIRELYPRLPQSPLPAIITCIASTEWARGQGLAVRLVSDICADLAERGFSAVEAYPDRTLGPDEASSADPRFWEVCGFGMVAEDERYPVMRLELE